MRWIGSNEYGMLAEVGEEKHYYPVILTSANELETCKSDMEILMFC